MNSWTRLGFSEKQWFTFEVLPGEHWFPVYAFEGLYMWSDLGRMLSMGIKKEYTRVHNGKQIVSTAVKPPKILRPTIRDHGQVFELIDRDGGRHSKRFQDIVMSAFGKTYAEGTVFTFWDGDPTNNTYPNIKYEIPISARDIELTAEYLREILHYSSKTGVWKWRVMQSPYAPAGSKAGYREVDGRLRIRIGYKGYLASRLAHLYMTGEWPPDTIDHKEGGFGSDLKDERWSNLRPADGTQQQGNRVRQRNNTTGFKGVVKLKGAKYHKAPFVSRIGYKGKKIYLGNFPTPEEAHAVYVEAAERLFGKFARSG